MPFILEGIVTTRTGDGELHLAPMGPIVPPEETHLLLRPFPTSTTYRHLREDRQGVFHITDDVLLFAYAALGEPLAQQTPGTSDLREDATYKLRVQPASQVAGFVLSNACRVLEFIVESIDDTQERMHVVARVVQRRQFRDFIGFNRAKHAVLEATILLTRLHLLDRTEVTAEFHKYEVIVGKTGGESELQAFGFLRQRLEQAVS